MLNFYISFPDKKSDKANIRKIKDVKFEINVIPLNNISKV